MRDLLRTRSETGSTACRGALSEEHLPASARDRPTGLARAAPLLVFLGLVIALLGPSLAGRQVVLPQDILLARQPWSQLESAPDDPVNHELGDVINSVYPTQHELFERLRDGRRSDRLEDVWLGVPGLPFIGWGALSVFNVPMLVAPFDLAWSWSMALRLLAAMGGAYALARCFGASRLGGTVAGVAYGLSGFMVGWLGWPQSHVGALLPWVLGAARVVVGPIPPWWAPGGLAAMITASWLGGFPALTAYTILTAGFVAVHAAATRLRGGAARLMALTKAAAAVLLGTATGAFTLLPSFLFTQEFALAYRDEMWRADVPLPGLLTFLVPKAFGDVVSEPVWLGRAFVESVGYAGVATVALGCFAWALAPRRPGLGLFTGLAVGFTALTYGAPPLPRILALLPFLRNHAPTRTLAIVGLSIAVAGGFGADSIVAWARCRRRPDWRVVVPGLVAGGAAALGLRHVFWAAMAELPPERGLPELSAFARGEASMAVRLLGALVVLILVGWLSVRGGARIGGGILTIGIILVVSVDLLTFAAGWNVQVDRRALFPDAPGIGRLIAASQEHRVGGSDSVGLPNTHLEYGFRDVRARAFYTQRERDLLDRAGAVWLSDTWFDLDLAQSGRWQPWLSLLGVRGLLVPDLVDRLGGVTAGTVGVVPLGPLVAPKQLTTTSEAPLSGTISGAQLRVGTYERMNAGAVVVTVTTADGQRRRSARQAAAMSDLEWSTFSFTPLNVTGGEVLQVTVRGTATTPAGGVAVFGELGNGEGGMPSVAWRYGSDGLELQDLPESTKLRWVSNDRTLPLVSAVPRGVAVAPGEALSRLAGIGSRDLHDVAFVEGPRDLSLPSGDGSAEVLQWRHLAGRIEASVRSSDGAVLVALDRAAAGWTALIDGEEAPVLTANHAFLGVAVPPGERSVVLSYETPGFTAGKAVSLTAAALVVLASATSVLQPAPARRRLARLMRRAHQGVFHAQSRGPKMQDHIP